MRDAKRLLTAYGAGELLLTIKRTVPQWQLPLSSTPGIVVSVSDGSRMRKTVGCGENGGGRRKREIVTSLSIQCRRQ